MTSEAERLCTLSWEQGTRERPDREAGLNPWGSFGGVRSTCSQAPPPPVICASLRDLLNFVALCSPLVPREGAGRCWPQLFYPLNMTRASFFPAALKRGSTKSFSRPQPQEKEKERSLENKPCNNLQGETCWKAFNPLIPLRWASRDANGAPNYSLLLSHSCEDF